MVPGQSRRRVLQPPPLIGSWAPGPAQGESGPVVVSFTDLRWRARDGIGMMLTGLRLRMGWYALPGAVGLWLWALPLERRSGSISIWTSEDDLRRFVALPAHVAIMRRYRDRGTLRSATWRAERFARGEVLARARRWIAEPGETATA
jgi:hypothetical protein